MDDSKLDFAPFFAIINMLENVEVGDGDETNKRGLSSSLAVGSEQAGKRFSKFYHQYRSFCCWCVFPEICFSFFGGSYID